MAYDINARPPTPLLKETILSGIGRDVFDEEYRERRHLVVRSVLDTRGAEDLFGPSKFDAYVAENNLAHPGVEIIADGSTSPPPVRYGVSKVNALDVFDALQDGKSVRLRNVCNHNKNVAEACIALSHSFKESVLANVYVTPSNQQGFNPHYDDHDVWILQTSGSKSWRIYEGYENQVALPFRGNLFEADIQSAGEILDEFDLHVGDMLYIPRGIMHSAGCSETTSIHITFGFTPVTVFDVLQQSLLSLRETSEYMRRAIPFEVFEEEGARDEFFSELFEETSCAPNRSDLQTAIEIQAMRLTDRVQHVPSGHIARFFEPASSSKRGEYHVGCKTFFLVMAKGEESLLFTKHSRAELSAQETSWLKKMRALQTFQPSQIVDQTEAADHAALLIFIEQLCELLVAERVA